MRSDPPRFGRLSAPVDHPELDLGSSGHGIYNLPGDWPRIFSNLKSLLETGETVDSS